MIDEKDLSEQKKWLFRCWGEKAVEKLRKKRVEAYFAPNISEACSTILNMIPEKSVIGFADSVTLHQIGIFERLNERNPKEVVRPIVWNSEGYLIYEREERRALEQKVLTSDVYICGVNAITLDGKIVSTDGLGNRVAPMIYGPRRTIIVAGANKIVPDVEAARDRIRRICAPLNARRHSEKHHNKRHGSLPCARTGFCVDCNLPERICCFTVIIENTAIGISGGREEPKNVVIIGDELGI